MTLLPDYTKICVMDKETLRQKLRRMAEHQGNEAGSNTAERRVALHKLRLMRFEDNEMVVKIVKADLKKLSQEELIETYTALYLDAMEVPAAHRGSHDAEVIIGMVKPDLVKLSREELEEIYIDLYLDLWDAPK